MFHDIQSLLISLLIWKIGQPLQIISSFNTKENIRMIGVNVTLTLQSSPELTQVKLNNEVICVTHMITFAFRYLRHSEYS